MVVEGMTPNRRIFLNVVVECGWRADAHMHGMLKNQGEK